MPATSASLQSFTRPAFTIAGREEPGLARDVTLVQIDEDIDGLRRLAANFIAMGPPATGAAEASASTGWTARCWTSAAS